MGTWGIGSFENDMAADWVYQLESNGVDLIRATLEAVVQVGDAYLDADEGQCGVGAADLLARLHGQGGQGKVTETLEEWLRAHPVQPPKEWNGLAVQALQRVMRHPSELLTLWEESSEFSEWRAAVLELEKRLQA